MKNTPLEISCLLYLLVYTSNKFLDLFLGEKQHRPTGKDLFGDKKWIHYESWGPKWRRELLFSHTTFVWLPKKTFWKWQFSEEGEVILLHESTRRFIISLTSKETFQNDF